MHVPQKPISIQWAKLTSNGIAAGFDLLLELAADEPAKLRTLCLDELDPRADEL